jgi:FkbM family methyltransferase
MFDRKEYINSELPIKSELLKFFPKDSMLTIFDVGACEAEDSIRYSNLFPNAKIYAFEPVPENFNKAKENIAHYQKSNQIFIYPFALNDIEGEFEFYVSSGSPKIDNKISDWDFGNKSSSLLKPGKIKHTHEWLKFNRIIKVQTKTLMRFCSENNINKIHLLHLDVQGAELNVLKSAGDLLNQIDLIWLEVSVVELYKNQALEKDIRNFLNQKFELILSRMEGISGDQFYVNRNLL